MNDRYTSPALSRDLAAAGLEQRVREYGAYYVMGSLRETQFRVSVGPASFAIRALDLTDVLHEIETRGATWLVETDGDTYCATAVLNPKFSAVMGGPTAVEAAGLCLLALLDKGRMAGDDEAPWSGATALGGAS